jgi:hypothetical protein
MRFFGREIAGGSDAPDDPQRGLVLGEEVGRT